MTAHQNLRLPAIDIRPLEYRPRQMSRREHVMMLVVGAAAVVVAVLAPRAWSAYQQAGDLKAEQAAIAAQSQALKPQVDQVAALRTDILRIQGEIDRAKAQQAAVGGASTDWDVLLRAVFVDLPDGVALRSVKNNEGTIAIDGASSAGFPPLQDYYARLVATKGVDRVVIDRAGAVTVQGVTSLGFNMTVVLKVA